MDGSTNADYQITNSSARTEALVKKTGAELKSNIRTLSAFHPFSSPWLHMVERIHFIANIALLESGKDPVDGPTTLWEGEDLCIRYMLEEGKLNLCLRNLVSLAELLASPTTVSVESLATASGLTVDVLGRKIGTFERSSGMLLRCAYEKIESIQTTDLAALTTHCETVLKSCVGDNEAASVRFGLIDFDLSQPVLVLSYLASLTLRIDDLNEQRVLNFLLDTNMVNMVLAHVNKYGDALGIEGLADAAMFMGGLSESEQFGVEEKDHVSAEGAAFMWKFFSDKIKPEMAGALKAVRRRISPFGDLARRMKRHYKIK